jgi:threonine synthase
MTYSHKEIHTFCPDCPSPFPANYDLKNVRNQVDRDEISRRRRGMWRWHELLPIIDSENIVFLE